MKLKRFTMFAVLAVGNLTLSVAYGAHANQRLCATLQHNIRDSMPGALSAPDWTSIRKHLEQHRYAVLPIPNRDGHQARNPAQQWHISFDGRGFTTRPNARDWQWGLELCSYGFPGHERAVTSKPRVSAAGQRVTYDWDTTLQEWFVNDARGLEHGFTVRSCGTNTGGPFLVNLAVRGGLRPEVQADGRVVHFVNSNGVTALTYAGLTVLDADGRNLRAHFEPVSGGLCLAVEEHGARYPLTIDPIAQQAYLKASNTGSNDWFGLAVAVSGDTVVVGARSESSNATGVNGNQADNSATNSGAAYVFVREGTTWSQQAYLKASNTGASTYFGWSVAVSGDTVVVGSPYKTLLSGAAYVFVRSGTNWSQQAYLTASNAEPLDQFGFALAVSGDTLVVGAPQEDGSVAGVNGNQSDNGATSAGAAYVFVRNGTNWSQQAYLKASNTETFDQFGSSVSLSGDTVVVGAGAEDSSATGVDGNQSNNSAANAGAAYVFVRNGTTWSQQAYLKASNTEAGDEFGSSVAVSVDTAVIGALGESSNATGIDGDQANNSAPESGAAYVYVRSGTTWSQQAYLKASNAEAGDLFGRSVAVSGDAVVVGARGESSNATGVNGDQGNNSALNSGAAYVFVRNGTAWSPEAYLKASNTGPSDLFGVSVGLSGDTAVVGAYGEASNTTGVNSAQNDNSATNAGAAYIFTGLGSLTPSLGIEQSGINVRVFWSLSAGGFVLEAVNALNVSPVGGWVQLPFPYQTNATDISVTEPISAGNRFYRLSRP